ncbi:hypothetical protein [Collimonas humicola]|uniref:hypothetical protein n=1 Tax=Collimonas humicola TaxID=2825886 RepID=UPI001B8CA16B|nr:hypothetical protein [Collimonas humicola]
MTYAVLTHTKLHRPGYRGVGATIMELNNADTSLPRGMSRNGGTKTERDSSDFLINGQSLLHLLVAINGGHGDFMGCFVRGSEDAIKMALDEILPTSDNAPRRVGLYICPECSDISCGRYSVLIEKKSEAVFWSEFAYENDYEPAWLIEGLGPFQFESVQYEQAIREAASP